MINADGIRGAIINAAAMLLMFGSLAIWFRLIQQRRRGLPVVPRRFRDPVTRVPIAAVTLALVWLVVALFSRFSENAPHVLATGEQLNRTLIQAAGEKVLVLSGLGVALCLGIRFPTQWIKLGFRTDHVKDQLLEGVLGFVAAMLPVTVVMKCLESLKSDETVHAFLRMLLEVPWGTQMLLIVFTAAVLAPLAEELLFRVVLQTWLTSHLSPTWGILITSVLFASVHEFPDALGILPLGLILGVLFERRRSYLAVVTMHAAFNSYNLLAALALRQ